MAASRDLAAVAVLVADPALRSARVCYDHLAGERAVRLFAELRSAGLPGGDDGCAVTPPGERYFARLGIDLAAIRGARRVFARPCLDWTERRPHLAGALGASILVELLDRGWIVRVAGSRAVTVSPRGDRALAELARLSAGSRLRRIEL